MRYKIKKAMKNTFHSRKSFQLLYNSLSYLKTIRNKHISNDEIFFRKRYKEYAGRELNLDAPTRFNEKLIWLQLHDHNPLYTIISDKYLVKRYVADKIGANHVAKLYGVWNSVDSIDFSKLPDECVLKCNHDCGSVYIKRSGVFFDEDRVKRDFKRALKRNYYDVGRVWGYKNIVPKVICEEYIKSNDGCFPRDYKIFCFDGEPQFAFVASDREKETKFDFFDVMWNRIPVKQYYPNSNYDIPCPNQWNEMLDYARKLSVGIPHVRTDFYINSENEIIFGEMTLCHFSGKEPFEPDKYDEIFGSYLKLPI